MNRATVQAKATACSTVTARGTRRTVRTRDSIVKIAVMR